jgi:predicted GIY-YIG superfamily endonuclease
MAYVYILRCADGALYIGVTTALDSRIARHNRGTGSAFTATRYPVSLAYREEHSSMETARARERQLKRWTRAKKEALIAGDLLS